MHICGPKKTIAVSPVISGKSWSVCPIPTVSNFKCLLSNLVPYLSVFLTWNANEAVDCRDVVFQAEPFLPCSQLQRQLLNLLHPGETVQGGLQQPLCKKQQGNCGEEQVHQHSKTSSWSSNMMKMMMRSRNQFISIAKHHRHHQTWWRWWWESGTSSSA